MNHSECWDLLSPSLDGELDPERSRQVAAHVNQCLDCRARLDEMASISRRIRSLDRVPMPEDLKASLRSMAAGSAELKDRRWGRLASPWAAASLVAAGLLVIVGILSLRPEPARVFSVAATRQAPEPARADGALEGVDAGRKEDSPEPPATPPASAPPRGKPRQVSRASQPETSHAPDDIAKRRARLEAREESRKPHANTDQPASEGAGAVRESEQALPALGYAAGEVAPQSAPPAGAVDEVMAHKAPTEAFELQAPEGAYATTLIVSGDAVSFGPLRPQPGGRARSSASQAGGWRIAAIPAPGAEAKAQSARAPESGSAAGSPSATLEKKEQGNLPDPVRLLTQRRGPGGTIVLLLHVDETGLIDAAHPVGAQPLGPDVAAAVARLLQGSSLFPYHARQPAGFPLEVTLPPAEAQ